MVTVTKRKLEANVWAWYDKADLGEYIREDDTIFHDRLEFNTESGEVAVGTYSQNSWTEGWVCLFEFPNGQDIANMDMPSLTDYSDVEDAFPDLNIFSIDSDHPLFDKVEEAKRASELEGLVIETEECFRDTIKEAIDEFFDERGDEE